MLMVNKNKTEDISSLSPRSHWIFPTYRERKKNRKQPEPNWSIWQFYLRKETI